VNKLSQLIEEAETSIHELANDVGVDVLEISLAKRGLGAIHFDTVCAIADAMECDIEEIYPSLDGYVDEFNEEGISHEELRTRMLSTNNWNALFKAGIDPDPDLWFMILKLKSGNERRYRISSIEMLKMTNDIETSTNSEGYFVFIADCRTILLKKSGMKEIQFRNEASCARFSSIEDANNITIVSSASPRPEPIRVEPDYPSGGPETCPFRTLVDNATEGRPIGPFFKMEDEGDDRYINIDEVELMEIPLGLIIPSLYEDDFVIDNYGAEAGLEHMVPAGSA
jgi:DNA-binding Xre family transcriptional regulator